MPVEVLQTIQQLSSPKLGHNGLPCRPKAMTFVNGRPTLPEMGPLQQCQHLQQIQSLIHYHEQQVKYRSYIQLDILRHLRKQLNDQMLLHPHRRHYEALVEAAKCNRLSPLSVAERAQLEYFTQMADWTLDARASLQGKESVTYLTLFGRQVSDFKSRLNEITTHEQFQVFAPMFAERIDYHRELIHTLNRRSSVSIA